jgi:hypothetical protein
MAEKTILVCDACGRPAAETVTIRVGRGNFVKDLCATHVSELISGARKPRPGRRKGSVARAPATKKAAATRKRRGRPRSAAKRSSSSRKPSARASS